MPDTPGPGYWPSDPRRAGWKPPSATIWFERMAALPGVRWAQLHNDGFQLPLGVADGNGLFVSGAGELLAVNVEDGSVRWRFPLPEEADRLLLDAQSRLIYSASSEGSIQALSTSALGRGEFEAPAWSLDLGEAGIPILVPLPGGGLIASSRSALLGISVQGEVLWRSVPAQGIVDWAESGASLMMLTTQGTWRIDREQAVLWPASVNAQKIIASDEPFIYAEDGLYRLNLQQQSAELFFALPRGFPRSGDLAELPGGGLLVVHADPADTRLIAIEADGSLRWERSVEGLGARTVELLAAGGQIYAAMQLDLGSSTGVEIFHVRDVDGRLTRVFSGGTRSTSSNPADFFVVGDSVLISVADVGLIAWEPELALQTILGGLPPDG